MYNKTELAKVVIKDDDGRIISEIVIYDKDKTKLYKIQDFVSDKIYTVPYIFVDNFLTFIKFLKEVVNINIEIKEYKRI